MEEQGRTAAQWKGDLSVREQIQIAHAADYVRTYADAGIPGHNHIVLIAKLAKKLDDLERRMGPLVQKIAWSEDRKCWYDIYTSVRVDPKP